MDMTVLRLNWMNTPDMYSREYSRIHISVEGENMSMSLLNLLISHKATVWSRHRPPLWLRAHHHRRGSRTGHPVPRQSHPEDRSSVFPMHADTPHRTGRLHGLPHFPDCSMSHSQHSTPLYGSSRPTAPSVVVCTQPLSSSWSLSFR